MKLLNKLAVAGLAAASILSFGVEAGINTNIQYSSAGDGNYDVKGITSFDFQDDSTLLIRQDNVTASNGAATLAGFFGSAGVGDTVSFDIHYQSRLTGMTAGAPEPNLDEDGAGSNGGDFEVTVVLTGRETARVIAIAGQSVFIQFTSISGSYKMYHDTTPNSNLVAGTGFDDGVEILSGTLGLSTLGGTFTANATGAGNGSTFLSNTITYYNDQYLEADPDTNAPLIGTSVDTTINLSFGTAIPIDNGATIGINGYTVLGEDLKLAADATLDYQGVPEPSVLLLFGTGLIGLGFTKRK